MYSGLLWDAGVEAPRVLAAPEEWREKVLWRYVDLYKFISMVKDGDLFFPSVAALRAMDPYEGSLTTQRASEDSSKSWSEVDLMAFYHDQEWEEQERAEQGLAYRAEHGLPSRTYCVSWHAKAHESQDMWKLYTLAGKGVAIKTTAGKLDDALKGSLARLEQRNMKYFAGPIEYIDHEQQHFAPHVQESVGELSPFFHKDESFQHESELRVLLHIDHWQAPPFVAVPVNWAEVVDAVVLPPGTEPWIIECVKHVAGSLADRLVPSRYDRGPIFRVKR